MFTQFHNFMEVEYLPVVYPPEIKQENALHFAEDTSYAMAHALNVLPTSYSYGDSMIMARAVEAGKANCSNYMVQMAWVKDMYGVNTAEAMELLENFLAMNPDSDGRVKAQEFWAHFGLDCSPLCKKVLKKLQRMLPCLTGLPTLLNFYSFCRYFTTSILALRIRLHSVRYQLQCSIGFYKTHAVLHTTARIV
jgi:hypothetical protein